jgi:hypothetical protein
MLLIEEIERGNKCLNMNQFGIKNIKYLAVFHNKELETNSNNSPMGKKRDFVDREIHKFSNI